MRPSRAMIFAAGFGTRMRHLTKTLPKPLVPVLKKPMIAHTIDLLTEANISSVVVNTHYFAETLEEYLSSFPMVHTIRETPDILETGGGLKNALPLLGNDPVFTINCDSIWLGPNPVSQLAQAWNPDHMDGVLLLLEKSKAHGYLGTGDFFLSEANTLKRKGAHQTAPFVYSGVQILKTDMLQTIVEKKFSISLLWDAMIKTNRLFGILYDGEWVDVGHPEGVQIAEKKAHYV